jgi:YhcH/YjgK/YiaL family protein
MIIDSILGLEHYYKMNSRFKKVAAFLSSSNFTSLETGRYDIDGNNAYAMVSENDFKDPENAKLEAHNLYIDIQIPLSAGETFGWKNRLLCRKHGTYDEKKDIIFFDDNPDVYCTVNPLDIVIFFPHDAHAPLIGNEGKIKKIVIKVKA